jgi:hypothetical protein
MTAQLLQDQADMWAEEASRAAAVAAEARASANSSRSKGLAAKKAAAASASVGTGASHASSPVLLFSPHLAPPSFSTRASPASFDASASEGNGDAAEVSLPDGYNDPSYGHHSGGADFEPPSTPGGGGGGGDVSESPPIDVTVAYIQRQRAALAANDSASVVQPLTLTEPELFAPPPSANTTRGRGRAVEVDIYYISA